MAQATIFNIARYSIHDGPGIRTSVFFKGCPLSCKWCHNPEGIDPKPWKALNGETIGYEIGAPELLREITKDRLFYEQSGGGVTFSGGEPLLQADFLLEMLELCRDDYINTAIDTSGYCDTQTLLCAAERANYILYDIKFIDDKKHGAFCGASNKLILDNLNALARTRTRLLIRIPLIPTINDGIEEMVKIFNIIEHFDNIETVHILPYHNIQLYKYKRLGMVYGLADIPGEESRNLSSLMELFGAKFRVKRGG